jgi:hypothetical protein
LNDSLRIEETALIKGKGTFNDSLVTTKGFRNESISTFKGDVTFYAEPKASDRTYTYRMIEVMEGWITHDQGDTDTLSLGTLPANAIVLNVNIWTYEAFNSDGTDEVCVGILGTSIEEYATDVDVSNTGVETWAPGTYAKIVDGTSRAVKVVYHTSDKTNLTTGECHVLLEWCRATANP